MEKTSAAYVPQSLGACTLSRHGSPARKTQLRAGAPQQAQAGASGRVRPDPISPARQVPLSPALVVSPPLSRPALRRRGKMAAEKQVPGGGSGGGGGSTGSGGGRGAGGEENKENERPSAGSKANKEFGDSLSLESILE